MKKNYCLLLLLFILASCKNNEPVDLSQIPTTSTELAYPAGIGSSGDSVNGLLGYGYDATGFCDTISVRAKVLESLSGSDIVYDHPSTTFPTLISGASFTELMNKISNPNIFHNSGTAHILHLKSLLKLAKSDSIDSNSAFTYYACTYINAHWSYFYSKTDVQNHLTPTFKNDIVSLTAQGLVAKYGTHILTNVFNGTRFEVLYRCKFTNYASVSSCEQLFYNRMKAYTGGTFGIITDINTNTKLSQTDEQLIYNSSGSRKKLCGIINASDYNPDSIRVDVGQIFNSNNIKTQFIAVGTDGILPLYELISDATKKQEVKEYIEKYMSASSVK